MPSTDGAIRISTKIDTSGFNSGIRSMENGFGRLGSLLGKAAGAFTAGAIVKKVADIGKQALETAAEVRAANSQFEQAFGALGDQAEQMISRVASASGIVETRLQGSATSIFAFARTTGMASDQALGLTERALTAAADSAAYYDRSLEETSETLMSFLKGNYENDAALGLSATETTRNAAANKLYGKSFNDLSEAQKQLTLLQMVEDANALSGAMGQAAREADGWENVTGNLKEAWRQLLAVAGEPVLDAAVPIVKSLSGALGELTGFVRDQVGAFQSWAGGLDLGPLQSSFSRFKTSVIKGLKLMWSNTEPLRALLKRLFTFLIETGFPALLDALNMVSSAVNTVWSIIRPIAEGIANALDSIIGKIKTGVAWLYRLFGMDPPDWTQDKPDNSFEVDTGDATDDFGDLTDAAEGAEDAIEDANDAASGSGGSGGSQKRDVLGFDEITKLSDQSSGGSGGSGGSSGGTGTDASGSAPSVSQAAKANEELQRGAEQTKGSIDDLGISIELLTGKLKDAIDTIGLLLVPRSATITLKLKKGDGYDDLLDQWNSLSGGSLLKTLLYQLTLDIKARVAIAVQAEAEQAAQKFNNKELNPTASKDGGKSIHSAYLHENTWWDALMDRVDGVKTFANGLLDNWQSFGKFIQGLVTLDPAKMGDSLSDWWDSVGQMNDGLNTVILGSGKSGSKSGTGILDVVKKWWNSLTRGKATKTLDLKGGRFSGGSGGFSQGVKVWTSLTDETITKTLKGKETSTYTNTQKDWKQWKDGSILKTVKASKNATYTTVKSDWAAWKDGSITKTTKGSISGTYTSAKNDWTSWRDSSITKTAKGAFASSYSSTKSDWAGWRDSSITKTVTAAKSSNWESIKSDWNSLRDKSVTGRITLTATVSNIKTWMNTNVIDKLNNTIHKVFPGISIPRLARGGIVNRATLAQIGEAGREAVLPLERNTGWMDLLAQKIGEQPGGARTIVIPVYIGEEKVAEHVVKHINNITKSTGECPIRV